MKRSLTCPQPTECHPRVSVIVPVYDDPDRLCRCLRALEAQTYPRSRYEIIVVDNGSSGGPPRLAAEFPRVRLLQEGTPGSYAARNRGLAIATGDVIAFTDADCVPDSTWLEKGVGHLQQVDNCGLVGGRIRFQFHAPARPTLYELYDSIFDFDQERFIERGRFACTANLLTYAAVFRRVGPFDGLMKSVGDRDWGNRVAAGGYALIFAPDALVSHPARATLRELCQKRLRVAGGHHDRARKKALAHLRFLNALRQQFIRNPAWGAFRIWHQAQHHHLGTKLKILGIHTLLCYAQGFERIRLKLGGASRR